MTTFNVGHFHRQQITVTLDDKTNFTDLFRRRSLSVAVMTDSQ